MIINSAWAESKRYEAGNSCALLIAKIAKRLLNIDDAQNPSWSFLSTIQKSYAAGKEKA